MEQQNIYTIQDFVSILEQQQLLVTAKLYREEHTPVKHLTFHSEDVQEHTAFVCKGATFKAEYLESAISKGCVVYLSEIYYDCHKNFPYILVSDIRKAMAVLANWFYGYAWKDLHITAVGGTKGKSTTAYYVRSILDHYLTTHGKQPSGILSSIEISDGIEHMTSHNTTPEAIELHQHLRNAVTSHLEYVEMEVSSQGLKYNRLDGIRYDVGIFLNISEDHISPVEHPDFEDYFQSKLKMFEQTDTAIVHLETAEVGRVLEAAQQCRQIITVSTKEETADYYAYDIHQNPFGFQFRVKCDTFDELFHLSMPGFFNVDNALAAIAATQVYGIPVSYAIDALADVKVKGRMERYLSEDNHVVAIVDFAHNKLSFETLYQSTRKEYPDYEIVTVFGCPGRKAFNRREDLGTVSGQQSDFILLTSDDPGTESPQNICEEIANYVGTCPYEIIIDRAEAIHRAICTTTKKRVVLIVGKGPDTTIRIGSEDIPYEGDAAIAIRSLREYDDSTS